jgi:hypothetical protein
MLGTSLWQEAEQPSPGVVLPSSHCSAPSFVPLPQLPLSLWQVAEQPSPGVVLPSSHCSAPSFVPLPQTPPSI